MVKSRGTCKYSRQYSLCYGITCLVTRTTLPPLVVLACPLARVYPLVILVCPLVALVCPLVVFVCLLVVLVCPLVVSVCPLMVLVVLSVGLFITDLIETFRLLRFPTN